MKKYRDSLDILADVISVAMGRAMKTQIMYQANLSFKLLDRYMSIAVGNYLIASDGDRHYIPTKKGEKFLMVHARYLKHRKSMEKQKEKLEAFRVQMLESMLKPCD